MERTQASFPSAQAADSGHLPASTFAALQPVSPAIRTDLQHFHLANVHDAGQSGHSFQQRLIVELYTRCDDIRDMREAHCSAIEAIAKPNKERLHGTLDCAICQS